MIALLFLFLPFGVVVIIFLFVNAFKTPHRRGKGTDDGDLSFEFFSQTTLHYYRHGEKTNARSFFEETTSLSLFIRTRERTHESALLVRLVLFDTFSSFLQSSRVCFLKKSEVNQREMCL